MSGTKKEITEIKAEAEVEVEVETMEAVEELPAKIVPQMCRERNFLDIRRDLAKNIPDRFVKTRPQGNMNVAFIEWYTACKLMDLYAGGWTSEVTQCREIGKYVVVNTKITLHCKDGVVEREATGAKRIDKKAFMTDPDKQGTDPYSVAEAMSFKRACAKFGLALHLYS